MNNINMNVHTDCFPCFLKQANLAMAAAGADETQWHEILLAVLPDIGAADFEQSPSHVSSLMHRRIRKMLGADPFAGLKQKYNELALELLPDLSARVRSSHYPLATASRLAIAGNIIDFGIFKSVDIKGTIDRALNEPLAIDDTNSLRNSIDNSDKILYLLDNAGEIVLDILLIEELIRMGKQVTAVTRGAAILNDVTLADAEAVGLDKICTVMDNGSDAVGTVMEDTSEEFNQLFRADGTVIISKGQGNFETLYREKGVIYHLFQAKCNVVADAIDVPERAMLLIGSKVHT